MLVAGRKALVINEQNFDLTTDVPTLIAVYDRARMETNISFSYP
jgi:hypothetical protein